MTLVSGFFVFLIIWWLIFLPVLSLGVRNQQEAGDDRMQGTDPGAPAKAGLKKKMLITSGIAFVITAIIYYLVNSGLLLELL